MTRRKTLILNVQREEATSAIPDEMRAAVTASVRVAVTDAVTRYYPTADGRRAVNEVLAVLSSDWRRMVGELINAGNELSDSVSVSDPRMRRWDEAVDVVQDARVAALSVDREGDRLVEENEAKLFEAFCAGFEATAPDWCGDLFDPVSEDHTLRGQVREAFNEWRASLGEGEGEG